MPNPSFTPFTQPEEVAAYLQPVVERLALSFSAACSRTRTTFTERKWSEDAALSAFMIRKEVIEALRSQGVQVEEEDVELEKKALCGMLLTLPAVHLKVRKSKDGEIPAAGSQQSLSFYNWNLLAFPQLETDKVVPLHLLLLWNDNQKGELDTLLLVCVEGNEWRWRVPVFQRENRYAVQRSQSSSGGQVIRTEHFTTAFDAGNEDVPLKRTEKERSAEGEESLDTADSGEARLDEKKKA